MMADLNEEQILRVLVTALPEFAKLVAVELLELLRAEDILPRFAPVATTAISGIVIDHDAKRVTRGGIDLGVKAREFAILEQLVSHRGRTLSREQLLEAAWPSAIDVEGERTVDVHITRLRRRLGDEARLIATVRGYGYRFDPP